MDKVIKYQQAIQEVLQEYKKRFRQIGEDLQNQVVSDEKNHHYQFLWMGWKDYNQIFNVSFHADIIDGKIWIQRDNTEVGFANLLVEKGVPKSDIVLAYFPAEHREHTEFAVA